MIGRSLVLALLPILVAVSMAQSQRSPYHYPWMAGELTPVIDTANGPVQGYRFNGVDHHANIPFAEPPVFGRRFQSPQPLTERWNETRRWQSPGPMPMCPQIKITDKIHLGEEDCLYLDVYVPSTWKQGDPPLPVMFWIFGGAYVIGDKYEFGWYDSTNIVRNTGVIMVNANYRLGAFGFLALDGLRAENPERSTGNYALQDQNAALKWVAANIAKFGGDPSRVTIFGESAGSWSVCSHLVMESSRGLFSRAIGESCGCEYAFPYEHARNISLAFSKDVGCDPSQVSDVVACMRALPVNKLLGATSAVRVPETGRWLSAGMRVSEFPDFGNFPQAPVVDGAPSGLKDVPLNLIKRGQWAKVPVIEGTNHDEFALFILLAPIIPSLNVTLPLTAVTLNKTLTYMYGADILKTIFKAYPIANYRDFDALLIAAATDQEFTCMTRRALRAMVENGGHDQVWQYWFTYLPNWPDVKLLGAYHTLELDFVFDNAWPPFIHTFDAESKEVVKSVQSYWANMAFGGTPNAATFPTPVKWPSYDVKNKYSLVFSAKTGLTNNVRGLECDYWDTQSLTPRS